MDNEPMVTIPLSEYRMLLECRIRSEDMNMNISRMNETASRIEFKLMDLENRLNK